jgi:DNA-binding transcriptional LysR family regulator
MDKLRAMELFVRLAELNSFTLVAEEKNSSKSMISKEIKRLEDELGARLLHRSTRNIQLTPVGHSYLEHCRDILTRLSEAESMIQDLQETPKGKLRITAPMALGVTDLAKMFADFMQAYPDIELDIHLSDESIDLIEQGFDVGFRAASASFDSNYVGRPLTEFQYKICASRKYLTTHSEINSAQDLLQHNCFVYSYFRGKNIWPLDEGIAVKGNLKVNSTIFMMHAITNGIGIGFIPDFVCRKWIDRGDVVEILPDISRPKLTLYALYPARHFMPTNLRCCINFLENWFKKYHQAAIPVDGLLATNDI